MRRKYIYARKDTGGTWGVLAAAQPMDTTRWMKRGLSRFAFSIVVLLIVGGLTGTGVLVYNLINAEPNVTQVVEKAKQSMFQVFCGDAMGSGVAIEMDVPDSYKTAVWTAAHVVEGCDIGDRIELVNQGASYFGTLSARDPDVVGQNIDELADLAVIYLEAELPALEPAPEAQVGDWSIIIGNPWDEVNYVSFGVVSVVEQGEYKTDAAVNEGNSGGPMLDSRGRVLGLVSYKPVMAESTVTGSDAVVNRAEGIAAIKRLRLACEVVLTGMRECPFKY